MNASARRFEIGPVLLVLGALLLFASLFLEWFEPELTAWNAFEWLDLLLAVIALMVVVAAVGLLLPGRALLDADTLPLLVAAPLAIVAVQLLDPPPAAAGSEPSTGAWLALGGCLLMGAGAVLSLGRMHLSISFEGRDPRHRVSAVDARGSGGGGGTGGDEEPGPFDQGARRRPPVREPGAPAGPAGASSRGGSPPDAASGGPFGTAASRSGPSDRPAWTPRSEVADRRPGGASGAVRAGAAPDAPADPPKGGGPLSSLLPGRRSSAAPADEPVAPSGDAFDPPLDAPSPPAAVQASEADAGRTGGASPAPGANPPAAGGPAAPAGAAAPPEAGSGGAEPAPAVEGAPGSSGLSSARADDPPTDVQPPAGAPAPATPAGEAPRRSGGLFGSWFDDSSSREDDDDAGGGPGATRPAGS